MRSEFILIWLWICWMFIGWIVVGICCILILLSCIHVYHLFIECLVGVDGAYFAFGARFRAILALYTR